MEQNHFPEGNLSLNGRYYILHDRFYTTGVTAYQGKGEKEWVPCLCVSRRGMECQGNIMEKTIREMALGKLGIPHRAQNVWETRICKKQRNLKKLQTALQA